MAQLISIRLSRNDACPWGFRLQGGKDFGTPLVVQKVNNGSPAERAGLQAGDAVIKVNNTDVYNLRHKDAQDAIVRAGQTFEVTVQRGGSTWQPQVTPIGATPLPSMGSYVTPVTKTSLAAKHQDPLHIGSGHNNKAQPFGSVQLNGGPKNLVNKQYNSPLNMYSEQTIRETLDKHSEVLETGAVGVNFKKNEKIYNAEKSEVFKMLQESNNEPEPDAPTSPVHITAPSSDHSHVSPAPVTGLRHVTAPVTAPPTNNTGGLPAGQNICADCERLIVGVFVRIKDKNLHVECFKCSTCGTNLKNQGYYTIHNKLYCDIHAKLAARQNPPSGTEGCIPFTVPPGAKIPVSAISAALAAHSTHPLNGGTAPPPDLAPSTPGYAPVSAPLTGNLSGPKPYSFGAAPSPASPVSAPFAAPMSPYSAPLSPLANQQQPGKFPVSKPVGGFKEESINPEKPEEGVPLSQPQDSSFEANLCPIKQSQPKEENLAQEQPDAKDTIESKEQQSQPNEIVQPIEQIIPQDQHPKEEPNIELKLQEEELKLKEVSIIKEEETKITEELKPKEEESKPKEEESKPKEEETKPNEEEAKPKEDKPKQPEELKLEEELKPKEEPIGNLDTAMQSNEIQLNGNQSCQEVQSVHEHKIESQQSICSMEVTEITKDASKTISSAQQLTDRPCVPAPIISSEEKTNEVFKTAISQNEPIICNGNVEKEKHVNVLQNFAQEGKKQIQQFSNVASTGVLENKSFSSFMKSENVSETKVIKSANIVSETKHVEQSYSAQNTLAHENKFAPKSTPFYVSQTVLGDTVIHNPINLPQTVNTPAPLQQFSNPHQFDAKPEALYNPCFSTFQASVVDPMLQNPVYNLPQTQNVPIVPKQQFSNPPKKDNKQDTASNPCFPKLQFNFHPVQAKKRSNSLQIKKSTTGSVSASSSSFDLLSALTVAPEKPFSLCASPVSFSYTDTPSDLPLPEVLPIYATNIQPLPIQTENYKLPQTPIQPPYSPSVQNKPIVESPLSPKPTIPYKRTQSFPPELPEEVSSLDHSQFTSNESYKTTSFATGSYASNVTSAQKHDVPLHVHIAQQPRSNTPSFNKPAAIIPAYQTNIVTTEHREVQSNVFSPMASRSPAQAPGIPANKFNIQTSSNEAQIFKPQGAIDGNYNTGCETYQEESKVHHDYDKVTGLKRTTNVQESMRHKEQNRQQVSNTSEIREAPNMITKIERKHTVKEEFERTQKAKVIEIRTGPDGKVTRQEIASSAAPQSPLSYPPPAISPLAQQFGQSKHHQTLSQSHQTTSSLSAYGPQSLNQYKAPQPTGLPLVKSPGVSMAKTMSVPSVCDPTPPGAGGVGGAGAAPKGGAPKGGTFGVASAPKRGRGILNKAVGPGGRVPLCGHCNSYVRGPFISALGRIWCPDHFVCTNTSCKRPLADIGFVEEQGQLYCEYCFEQFIAPPCDKCHGKIKGDCLNAIGKHFHPECFNCSYCGKLFGNNPFFLEDGQPYCQADWNEMFTTKCFACGFPVEAGDRWVEALSNNYHSQCFNCTKCKKNLEGQSFYAKGGRPFCKNHAR